MEKKTNRARCCKCKKTVMVTVQDLKNLHRPENKIYIYCDDCKKKGV
jgi:hypothetical protein